MAIQFRCRDCEGPLRAPDNAAGKVMTCKECGTKNRIPARKAKRKKAAPRKAGGSGGGDLFAGDLSKEDTRVTVCQKCEEQYQGDEPVCPYCGWDHDTESYTKLARRRELKARGRVDTSEYFEMSKGEALGFVGKHWKLGLRSGTFVLVPGLLSLVFLFLVVFNGKTPPKMFFAFLATVFALGAIGWIAWIAQYLVRAKLDGDEKLDRISYDFFQCAAEGVSYLAIHVAWLLPAMLAMVGAYFYGEDQHGLGIGLMVAGPVLMLPFLPTIYAHLAMPVNWPGWLFTKGLQLWANVIAASFYWVGFTLLAMLPAGILFGVAFGVFSEDIGNFVDDIDYNAKLGYEKYLASRGEADEPQGEYREVVWDSIIAPAVITVFGLYVLGFTAIYPARLLAWYAYYFRKPLELIQEKKEKKYVAKEREVDEDGNLVVVKKGGMEGIIVAAIDGAAIVGNIMYKFIGGTAPLPEFALKDVPPENELGRMMLIYGVGTTVFALSILIPNWKQSKSWLAVLGLGIVLLLGGLIGGGTDGLFGGG